jgi:hypothetical protein
MPNATCFPILGKLAYSWGRTPVRRPTSTSACSRSDRAGSSARGGAHPFRKLAVEATDNGLLTPELAAGIARVKSAKSALSRHGLGVRRGAQRGSCQAGA